MLSEIIRFSLILLALGLSTWLVIEIIMWAFNLDTHPLNSQFIDSEI